MRLLLFLLPFFSLLHAASAPQLFKEFSFGEPKQKVLEGMKTNGCVDPRGRDVLCIDDYRFLDLSFRMVLFYEEEKLVSLVLTTEHTPENESLIYDTMGKKFFMVGMSNDRGEKLDIFALMKRALRENNFPLLKEKVETFKERSGDSPITTSFLDKQTYFAIGKQCANIPDLMKNADEQSRSLDLSMKNRLIFLQFTCPVAHKKAKKTKREMEDF